MRAWDNLVRGSALYQQIVQQAQRDSARLREQLERDVREAQKRVDEFLGGLLVMRIDPYAERFTICVSVSHQELAMLGTRERVMWEFVSRRMAHEIERALATVSFAELRPWTDGMRLRPHPVLARDPVPVDPSAPPPPVPIREEDT